MEFSFRLVLSSFSPVMPEVLIESLCGIPQPSEQTIPYQMTFGPHILSIFCLPLGSRACSVRASDSTHISSAEGKVGVVARLTGDPGV